MYRQRKIRAARRSALPFLYERISGEIVDRLADINRTFSRAALIGDRRICGAIQAGIGGNIDQFDGSDDLPNPSFTGQGTYELIISALDLHAVNDVPHALARLKAALKPDGLMLAVFFGGNTLQRLRHAFYAGEELVTGQVTPRIAPMIRLQQAAGLLQSAGFALPVADKDTVRIHYKNLKALYSDLRDMGETNCLRGRAAAPTKRQVFAAADAAYEKDENGRYIAIFEMIWLTGWSPHASQQQPLRPGSAKTRLSDALGVKETKL